MIPTLTEEQILNIFLAVPYRLHGRDLTGSDCYGTLRQIYKLALNISLLDIEEEYDEEWSWKGRNYMVENYYKEWTPVLIPRFLDIATFCNKKGIMNHAVVMLDEQRFIHTCRAGTVQGNLSDGLWHKRFIGFFTHKDRE
jgi:cell wall-associated NlpC family hydrolase